jgi:hypothetical protein
MLFPKIPTLLFRPTGQVCHCGGKLNVHKTRTRRIAYLSIGEFIAHITQLVCTACGEMTKDKTLDAIVSPQSKFGFNVIVYVGEALFLHHKSDSEIQRLLQENNITISLREIAHLGKKFIVYLTRCHQEAGDQIKQHMQSNGGYVLHLDGTCEGDSPHLMSCMDEISHIVLDNIKIPSENSQQIIPFLKDVQATYGDPIAVVHDMSAAIIKSVEFVFPGAKDFICHFHFLKDIGKDLFGFEYNNIRRYLRSFKTRSLLRKATRELKYYIAQHDELSHYLKDVLKNDIREHMTGKLPAAILLYLLISWVLEAKTESHGYGFPFDRNHMDFFYRLKEAYPNMLEFKNKLPIGAPNLPLMRISRALNDQALNQSISLMQEKVLVFDKLREAMRIALPKDHQGLKDEGDPDIKTIEKRVSDFRFSDDVEQLASKHIAYKKMIKQIDHYWNKLFADPIQVVINEEETQLIQPQRTNNIMETFFRDMKHDGRKKRGTSSLNKTLKSMLANTPLVKNLKIPEYREIILSGKPSLADRFADIDIGLIREMLKQEDEDARKYPKGMVKIFNIAHLPEILSKLTSKKLGRA